MRHGHCFKCLGWPFFSMWVYLHRLLQALWWNGFVIACKAQHCFCDTSCVFNRCVLQWTPAGHLGNQGGNHLATRMWPLGLHAPLQIWLRRKSQHPPEMVPNGYKGKLYSFLTKPNSVKKLRPGLGLEPWPLPLLKQRWSFWLFLGWTRLQAGTRYYPRLAAHCNWNLSQQIQPPVLEDRCCRWPNTDALFLHIGRSIVLSEEQVEVMQHLHKIDCRSTP